ncbi:MAG: hypothetical protein HKN19_02460 [Halioglobus sp.]|nr:hypothetical protein [Halioglobus sp.]
MLTGHFTADAGLAPVRRQAQRLPSARFIITILLLITCAASADATAQELLRVTIGAGEGSSQRYSSRTPMSVTTVDAARVILRQASGTDYRVEAGQRSLTWFQVQQVPADASYIAVTPQVEGDNVTLVISLAEKNGAQFTSLDTTVGGKLGEWIELTGGPSSDARKGGRQYSSSSQPDQLAIRVDKVR